MKEGMFPYKGLCFIRTAVVVARITGQDNESAMIYVQLSNKQQSPQGINIVLQIMLYRGYMHSFGFLVPSKVLMHHIDHSSFSLD